MPTVAPQLPKPSHCTGAPRRHSLLAAAAVLLAALPAEILLAAQTASTAASTPTSHAVHSAPHKHARPHRKHVATKPAAQAAVPPPPAAPPVQAPKIPDWPANQKPADASVVWDSHGLFIQASNSSLDQILQEVSLKTGAKVEGMGTDERIFGIYGPGPARDVLNKLLDGSGYNILMVGDLGGGAPRRIILSGQPTGPAQPSDSTPPASSLSGQPEQAGPIQERQSFEPPQSGIPGDSPPAPVPVRTPQQIMEQRQQAQQPQENPQN